MISPSSSIKQKEFFNPKIALIILPFLYLFSSNSPAYAVDHIDKGTGVKRTLETKVIERTISITELNSLKVFYRQLEKRDQEASAEKLASLWQEYELLLLALAGTGDGIRYSYETVRKAYSGEGNVIIPFHKTLLRRTGTPIK